VELAVATSRPPFRQRHARFLSHSSIVSPIVVIGILQQLLDYLLNPTLNF
jgi:hypothetical protein